jgi:hypothetical protein
MSKKIVVCCAFLFIGCSSTFTSDEHIKEEYFAKIHKDNSFSLFKKQNITTQNGAILQQVIPIEKLPEGSIVEQETYEELFLRVGQKHGLSISLATLGGSCNP